MDRVVEGYIEGVYYAVTVGQSRRNATATIGTASRSAQACRPLEFHNGRALPQSGQGLRLSRVGFYGW
ncbi:hypothetical protein [Nonomuraea sp. NPDC049129]|uniref:hypothetical protein n=1 Tax=Nonomuraea sp. NPDC049129 TaxID=3155272 RepID=UPI0034016302